MNLELHSHSKFSFDSFLDPIMMIKRAKQIGLDGIAITDHNTIKGGVAAQKNNYCEEFAVIIGSEIQTEAGDIIGLFLNEEIISRNSLEVVDQIHDQDGIAVLPHPFRGHNLSADLIKRIDLIEIFNARSTLETNEMAKELAMSSGKKIIVGSDAHFLSEIGSAKSTIFSNNNPRKDLLNGCSKIETGLSPIYLQSLSQTIKAIREKHYRNIPISLLRAIIQFSLRNMVDRRYNIKLQ